MQLSSYEIEDLEDSLPVLEKPINIEFSVEELTTVKTLNDLYELFLRKVEGIPVDDCTTQQAFYKIRGAFAVVLGLPKEELKPMAILKDILGRKNSRRGSLRKIALSLDVSFDRTFSNVFLFVWLSLIILTSIGAFLYTSIVLAGILIYMLFTLGYWVNDYRLFLNSTLGDLAEEMMGEHYLKFRRKQTTYNPTEMRKVFNAWALQSIPEYKLQGETVL